MDTKSMRSLLERHGFNFSKSLGQNFLVDKNIPEKIVRLSGITEADGVLEVGPGIGALTSSLCRAAGHVTAIELDKRLLPILEDTLSEFSNVDVVHGDVLKLDFAKIIGEKMPGLNPCVCANLPYNITTPALTAFINAGIFKSITVMIQLEVALRICAKPGTSDYGAFTVFANYHTQPEILFNVPPECFMPRPRVQSAVITLRPRKNEHAVSAEDEAMFFRVVRATFIQRRKTLVNALYAGFGNYLQKDELTEIVNNLGFNPQIRGETLDIRGFAMLSSAISDRINALN